MAAPLFKVYEKDSITPATSKDFDKVKAANVSSVYEVDVWNNNAMDSAYDSSGVSDVIEATVTVTDASGTYTGEVVTGKYVEVCVNNEQDPSAAADATDKRKFIPIGGLTKAPIRAIAYTSANDSNGGGKFDGASNDGTKAGSTGNYGTLAFRINLPANATSGKKTGKIRLEGYYV